MKFLSPYSLLALLLAWGVRASGQEQVPPLVQQKCSGCHGVPRPGAMRRDAWPSTIRNMQPFMERLALPFSERDRTAVTEFYLRNAPLALPRIPDDYQESGLSFSRSPVGFPSADPKPQVTSLVFTDLDGEGVSNDLIVTDNANNSISWLRNEGGEWTESILSEAPSPVRATPVDFDRDGDIDLAISCMGFMHPNDDLIGEFHLLENRGDAGFSKRVVLEGVPRLTDCAPGDFDGDGDIDFVLAMFGWRYTGGVGLLEQKFDGFFRLRPLLEVNGGMRVIANDANGDGLLDFVLLITQQHEAIVQFINRGDGTFDNEVITRASHPSFGSSSIRLADLDQDGDEDILYANGDMMDENPEPKPYHGVRWLENDGSGGYELHHLASMPGCYGAEPADMDGDGDLDVVISALYFQWKEHDFPSLAWIENRSGFREFTRRRIAYAPTNLANIAVGDIDGDGLHDIVGGGMHVPGPLDRAGRLTLWRQEAGERPESETETAPAPR